MLEWPRRSICETPEFVELLKKIKNPGSGRPKTWAYPWCLLNADLKKDMLVLDFGCGSYSNFTYFLSEVTQSITIGLDMAGVRKGTEKVRFVQNSVDKIEFPADFFDRVFSVSVLEHVPVPMRDRVLSEIFRVLRPGGRAVLTIDWVFKLNDHLLEQLIASPHLRRKNSTMYGNCDFAKIISDHARTVEPLSPIRSDLLPGHSEFNEAEVLANEDLLVTNSDMVPDVEPFQFTTVGLILKKHGTPARGM
jgi:SAM-dependent methyltransferase